MTTPSIVSYCCPLTNLATTDYTARCLHVMVIPKWSCTLVGGTTSLSSPSSASRTDCTSASSARWRIRSSRRSGGRTPMWRPHSTGPTSSTLPPSFRSPGSWRVADCAPDACWELASWFSGRDCVASTCRRRLATGRCSSDRRC